MYTKMKKGDETKEITKVQVFDGKGYREETDCNDVYFDAEISFDNSGSYSVYAKVQLEGSNEWLTTAPLVVNVISNGKQVIDTPEIPSKVCTEGEGMTVTFTRPLGAHSYGIEAYYIDENDEYHPLCYEPVSDVWAGLEDGDTLSLPIPEDCLSENMKFYVKVKAWAAGYEYNEKNIPVTAVKHYLEAHEAAEATYTEAGNIAYWSCDGCGKFFKDANGENETTLDEITIPVKDGAAEIQKINDLADKAVKAANTAKEKAAAAETAVNNMKNAANAAAEKAAQTKNDQYIADAQAKAKAAEDAQNAAQKAITDAVAAQNAANAAITAANKAISELPAGLDIGDAAAKVSTAQNTADGAGTKIDTAKTNKTAADSVVSGAKSKANKAAFDKKAEFAANGNDYVDPTLPKVSVKKPKAGKKRFTAKWKKISPKKQKKVKGIEIEYSLTPDFQNPKFKKVGKKKTSVTIKKLKSKSITM